MASVYSDGDVCFRVSEGFKVRKLHDVHYSLSKRGVAIDILLCRRDEAERRLWQMEETAGPLFGAVASGVKSASFGGNKCWFQQITRRQDPGGEMTIVVELRNGHALISILGKKNYSIHDFRDLLESLSATTGRVPDRPPETASDRRNWERALQSAFESAARHNRAAKDAPIAARVSARSAAGLTVGSGNSAEWRRRLKVFADHYQFCLYDMAHDPYSPFPSFGPEEMDKGWTGSKHAVRYFTRAHHNTHRVDIGLANSYAHDPKAERLMVHALDVSSGKLAILGHEADSQVELTPGPYTVYARAYNLGEEDAEADPPADDEELLQRDDMERYEIVIVAGTVEGGL
jgi:hypothetical protein